MEYQADNAFKLNLLPHEHKNLTTICYTVSMDTSDFQNLPAEQKIELVYKLWDEIAAEGSPIVLSDGVKKEINKRCAELDSDSSIAIDEDEMWRRVNEG